MNTNVTAAELSIKNGLRLVELTPEQKRQWEMTRAAILWHCPAFTHVWYTMMNKNRADSIALFTDDDSICPWLATDGVSMIINVNGFFKLNLKQRIFGCAHEILHGIFNHLIFMYNWNKLGYVQYSDGTRLDYDHQLMGICADYIINAILVDANIGERVQNTYYDTSVATANDALVDVYRRQVKKNDDGQGDIQKAIKNAIDKIGGKGKGFDKHLKPGTSEGKPAVQAAAERDDAHWKQEIAAGFAAAKAQGKLPASIERFISDIFKPKVDWEDHIFGLFAKKVGGSTYDWRTAERRLLVRGIVTPRKSAYGCRDFVVACDTSGSVSNKEVALVYPELAGMLETLRPRRIFVMWCDAKVHRVDEIEDVEDIKKLRMKKAPGGGGTNFIPVFEKIKKMDLEPDCLIYLTDGLGSFPDRAPSYPVIWANIRPNSKYPFGDVVNVPKQA